MTSFMFLVYASCVPIYSHVINKVLGRIYPPSTSPLVRYSPSWTLRVRCNFDTPSLVGVTSATAWSQALPPAFSICYAVLGCSRDPAIAHATRPLFNHLQAAPFSLEVTLHA